MHPFTRAGLGNAPFRCIGVTENWYSAAPGHKQPGGSCDYCGTGIAYEYHCQSADGKKFKVGCDCVLKVYEGDKKKADAEVQGFRKARADLARTKREAGRKARVEARLAQWEAERVARRTEFEAAEPTVCAYLDGLLSSTPEDARYGFMWDMAQGAQRFGSLTAGQLAAVKSSMTRDAQREADKAASRFVGNVGERIKGEFEIIAVKASTRQKFNAPWLSESVYWHLLKMNGRDLVTYYGTSPLGQRGDQFKGRFTVKEHETYKGAQQTKLQRPKVDEATVTTSTEVA